MARKVTVSTDEVRPSNVSQIDVARLAGVSQAAVSRAFTPGASVSPDTRARVLTAAERLGYRPNVIARSLIKHSTHIIGIVIVRFSNPFYWQVFREFTQKLQQLGYWTLLLNAAHDEVEETLPMALQYQVDGIVITSATLSSRMADECVRAGTPVVLLNRYVLGTTANAVCCDNVGGSRRVAEVLLESGHRRLAYIAGEEGSSTNRDREQGFTGRLQELGHQLSLRASAGLYTYEAGYQAARQLLQRDDRPDAIFCASDLIAMGVLDLARGELGIKVPDELSIIGFDDIPMASWPSYALTTIRQPIGRMVDTAIDVLMSAIDTPSLETVTKWIPTELVTRSSARLTGSA